MFTRINNQYSPTHPKANRWLTDFMIDLKLMKQGKEQYQPFTMDRLNQWSEWVSPEYETCADWELSFEKRVDLTDNLIKEHANAIMYFNGVVMDLKLMVSGLEYSEITDERLIEADKYWHELVYCKKHLSIRY
jgi:hypothetical protein